ncbi:MAG: hypothetical protein BM557_04940 [Flavobacterium sp. MedPE-SWcel]|nr:nuclear transport factor 2 family protein [uncultured Flavobacterium sp.]OIQ21104.1 MAG: hypothetical protein BM557_04940 [Flavobacterium sp. MedPE-SWcel]
MVNLDYSSMTGNPATNLSSSDIISGWKTVLPGFTNTHHQIGNFIIKVNENKANAFCYGTATHFIEGNENPIWTVIGSYDFELERLKNRWKIKTMKFNHKHQSGNNKLVEQAIKNVKEN